MRNACKKAVWSGAALLCSLLVLSSPGQSEVYSVNVVGFQKITVRTSGLSMVSVPFTKTTNNLDSVIGSQLKSGKSSGVSDLISIWHVGSQKYSNYWLKASDSLWYTEDGFRATNIVITPQNGLFIRSRETNINEVIVTSGDVIDADDATNNLVYGLNLVSYPFSTEIDINKSKLTNGYAGKSSGVADLIQLWSYSEQKYYTYWLKTDRKWYTDVGVLATNVFIGGGKGFWYRNRNTNLTTFAWVESRPYTF